MFPLGSVLFPSLPLVLHVFEPRYQALVHDCLHDVGEFGVVLITRGSEVGGGDQRSAVGTVARIEKAQPLAEGRWMLKARGHQRIAVDSWLADDPYPCALVRPCPDAGPLVERSETLGPHPPQTPDTPRAQPPALQAAEARVRRYRALLSELGSGSALPADLVLDEAADTAIWQLCGLAGLTPFDAQRLLETPSVPQRLDLLTTMVDQLIDDSTRLLTDPP